MTSEDIRSQLPDDTKRFETMDSSFKDMMKTSVDISNVVEVCSQEGMEENLREMIGILETCQSNHQLCAEALEAALQKLCSRDTPSALYLR